VTASSNAARAQAQATPPPADDEVEVTAAPSLPPTPPPAPPPAANSEPDPAAVRAWQAMTTSRLGELEARLDEVAAIASRPPPPPPARPVAEVTTENDPSADAENIATVLARPGFLLSGYAQGQVFASRASQDQLQQGGAFLNQDQFTVRRARLRADRRWTYAALALEVDGNTNGGLNFGLRRVEASVLWDREGNGAPLVMFTAGMFYIPFGYELPASARTRLFLERSLSSTALFPGQADIGVRLAGSWRFLRYAVALVNGEPIVEAASRPFRGDPNAPKDLVVRLGADTTPAAPLRIAGGVSFLQGKGFHAGADATKSGTVWRDVNENGTVDLGEVMSVPGTAATPSANFRRWAVGADLRVTLRTPLGLSRLQSEVVVASNMDRGLFVSDPITTGVDVRQFGFYAAVIQDLYAWGFVGFRVDTYNPNADLFESRAGALLPTSQTITTLSPLAGVRIGDRTRVSVQYDHIQDNLARDATGVPADLSNDQIIARLQVDL